MATAASIIADVRDLIGDPTYDTDGNPHPEQDGQFLRAQTIVRWINQAQSIIGQSLKGIQDWTALRGIINQDVYSIDPRYFEIDLLYYDGLVAVGPPSITEDYITTQNIVTGFTLSWSISRTAPPLKIRVWPSPGRTPGQSFLNAAIGPYNTSFAVVSAANFGAAGGPSFGWLLIGNSELVRYQVLTSSTNTFSIVTRAQGGTRAQAHNSGAVVQETNIWIRGKRLPTPVGIPLVGAVNPTPVLSDPEWLSGSYTLGLRDPLELPDYVTHLIVEWCLRRARIKENDQQAGDALLKNFADALSVAHRAQRRPRIGQAKISGQGPALWGGRVIIT